MKITTMPTNTQEMVTIIFKPSPPPDLSSLTLGAFTKGAMVPVQKLHILTDICAQPRWALMPVNLIKNIRSSKLKSFKALTFVPNSCTAACGGSADTVSIHT